MRKSLFLLILTVSLPLLAGATAFADNHESNSDKPSISASRTVMMSATVEAIDYETREVTLVGPEGNTVTMTASDVVRNLAQVEVGDVVSAEITEDITIEVFANPEGVQPGVGEFEAETAAELGAKPGAQLMDTVVITAVVEDINLEMNTFKLRGPEGNVTEFVAQDPENLRKAEVGDLVIITISETVGVVVETPDEG